MADSKISEGVLKKLISFQKNEVTEQKIYINLAKVEKNPDNREVLENIAREEGVHAEIFKNLTGESPKPDGFKVMWYTLISRTLGLTFGIKLMERGESEAEAAYNEVAEEVPEILKIAEDENVHESKLIAMINEERLDYLGSIVLGLNDALVELTGALAGLTFALQDTKLTAAAGLVTGIAASMSMAASEYLSSTADGVEKSKAGKSALYTGIAYIFTVTALILPYLLIANGIVALLSTLGVAVAIIFFFNYYISVARDENFRRRFSEMALISLGVAAISFGVGIVVRSVFGIDV